VKIVPPTGVEMPLWMGVEGASMDEQELMKIRVQHIMRRKMPGFLRVLCMIFSLKVSLSILERLPESLLNCNKQAP